MSVYASSGSAAVSAGLPQGDPIRVMVVDDSVVVRGLVSRWLAEEPGIEVVATHRTGREAVDDVLRSRPDVVVLDIEMPDLDGLSALPLLLQKKRDLVVIMASTLTLRNAEVSLKALSLGAADYVPKPETNRDVTTSPIFRREITEKVRVLGAKRVRGGTRSFRAEAAAPVAAPPPRPGFGADPRHVPQMASPSIAPAPRPTAGLQVRAPGGAYAAPAGVRLRPFAMTPPRVLAIGSSTGGPQALAKVVAGLQPVIDRGPVIIVQHMPATFTTILAEHLGRAAGRPSREAVHGEPLHAGQIYVAPGGKHLIIEKRGVQAHAVLDDGPPVNFCKPAVDPMFASAAATFGAAVLGVVLTGMGADGAHGAGHIVNAGGAVIAQDEATSVVWGMPGATAQAGHCAAVLPLNDIAPRIVRLFSGERT